MAFHRDLMSMSQEVTYWERLRMAVPYVAMEIQAQREKYRVLRENMRSVVRDYNKVGARGWAGGRGWGGAGKGWTTAGERTLSQLGHAALHKQPRAIVTGRGVWCGSGVLQSCMCGGWLPC